MHLIVMIALGIALFFLAAVLCSLAWSLFVWLWMCAECAVDGVAEWRANRKRAARR